LLIISQSARTQLLNKQKGEEKILQAFGQARLKTSGAGKLPPPTMHQSRETS